MNKVALGELAMRALTPEIPVKVLRGLDDHSRAGGDIDFIVPPGLSIRACQVVADVACENGWLVAGFRDIGYVSSVTFVKLSDAVKDDAVKLDFINGFDWYAVGTYAQITNPFSGLWDSIHQEWDDSRIAGALTFFQKIMASGSVSPKEWNRVEGTGADSTYLAGVASKLDFPITLAEIEACKVSSLRKWLLRAASGGVRSPYPALFWFMRSAFAHLRFKLGVGTRMGLVIGVSGLDGSGKSTLIKRFIDTYHKAGGDKPQLVHLLPSWIPTPHQLFRRHKTQTNYTRPYSEPPVPSRINGGLRLSFYLCVFALARLSLWVGMKRGRLIILDRSFLDFASDLTRSRIPAFRLPTWLIRKLVPVGRLFYLDASPEVVVARKGELTLEKARSLQMSYRATCKTVNATLLNGDETSDAVFKELLGHVSQEYMLRVEAAMICK